MNYAANLEQVLSSLRWMAPELALVGTILIVILADLVPKIRKAAVGCIALGGLVVAGLAAAAYLNHYPFSPFWDVEGMTPEAAPLRAFQGAYAIDAFSNLFKVMFVAAAILVGIVSIPAIRTWRSGQGEYFALLLSCTFGMALMASANDLLMMYLSLEFVSVTSYIMAGLLRKNRKSSEASLKYIIYGAAASGLMIYGMSFLYGMTGTLEVSELGRRMADLARPEESTSATMTALVTSVLIMAGFGYKIAAVPFHMWCPDVYEGAPTPVTAFFSVGPKAAGFAMLVRFLANVFPGGGGAGAFEWQLVIALLAVVTMAVGNFGAFHQQNLKRLLAYSSIAHAGYLLVAFVAFTEEARAALIFYLIIYVAMSLGAFLVVIVLEEKYGVETVDGCRGMGWRAPFLGVVMTIFLVSLTGIPPMGGFIAKVVLFSAVINHGLGEPTTTLGITLVVIAAIFTVISLYYYARIIAAMYLVAPREGETRPEVPAGGVYTGVLAFLAGATILLGVWWGWLQDITRDAARSFLQ